MKKLIWILLFLPFSAMAVSDGPLLTWTNPTTYNNGDPLQAGDITGYNVECQSANGNWSTLVYTDSPAGELTEYRFPRFTFQYLESYDCRLRVVDRFGVASGWAETGPFDIDPRSLNPVIDLGVVQ